MGTIFVNQLGRVIGFGLTALASHRQNPQTFPHFQWIVYYLVRIRLKQWKQTAVYSSPWGRERNWTLLLL